MNKEQQMKLMQHSSKSASRIATLGFTLSIIQCLILKYTSSYLVNSAINTLIGTLIFQGLFLVAGNKLSSFYSQARYFHFYITTFIFGQVTYWCLYPAIAEGDYHLISLKLYIFNYVVYHTGEFFFVCLSHPDKLMWSSFLLIYSMRYTSLLIASMIEYLIGQVYPDSPIFCFQNNKLFVLIGVILCIAGQDLRIGAEQTAKSNFNHVVQTEKSESHELVTRGVYQISRHPSYLGFFLHGLGAQLILGNVVFLIITQCATFSFYLNRIVDEEMHLVKFFGDKYLQYRKKVSIGIPFLDSAVNKRFNQIQF